MKISTIARIVYFPLVIIATYVMFKYMTVISESEEDFDDLSRSELVKLCKDLLSKVKKMEAGIGNMNSNSGEIKTGIKEINNGYCLNQYPLR